MPWQYGSNGRQTPLTVTAASSQSIRHTSVEQTPQPIRHSASPQSFRHPDNRCIHLSTSTIDDPFIGIVVYLCEIHENKRETRSTRRSTYKRHCPFAHSAITASKDNIDTSIYLQSTCRFYLQTTLFFRPSLYHSTADRLRQRTAIHCGRNSTTVHLPIAIVRTAGAHSCCPSQQQWLVHGHWYLRRLYERTCSIIPANFRSKKESFIFSLTNYCPSDPPLVYITVVLFCPVI